MTVDLSPIPPYDPPSFETITSTWQKGRGDTQQWMRIVVAQMGYGRRWRLLWSRDGREWREVRSLPYTPDEADSMLRRQEEHLESRGWKPADLVTELRMRRPSTSPVPTAAGGEATL